MGSVFHELWLGGSVFKDYNDFLTSRSMKELPDNNLLKLDECTQSFLKGILQMEPRMRPSINNLINSINLIVDEVDLGSEE